MARMLATCKQAWSELEAYQKWFLIVIAVVFPLGLVFPPVMEILLLPLSFLSCSN